MCRCICVANKVDGGCRLWSRRGFITWNHVTKAESVWGLSELSQFIHFTHNYQTKPELLLFWLLSGATEKSPYSWKYKRAKLAVKILTCITCLQPNVICVLEMWLI